MCDSEQMNIHFYGAAGEVTGACYLIETGTSRVLFDCGLVQGTPSDEKRNADPFPFDPATIDAVVLSHSHIDHSGRLPLLAKRGFCGPIYTQRASLDLCRIMLKDAGFINEKDVAWTNRKRARKGQKPVEPLYTVHDAELVMQQFVSLNYNETHDITPDIRICLHEAGHILGSAIVEVTLRERGELRKLVYSGDLGVHDAPILRDPAVLRQADCVLLECTYGNRLHRSKEQTISELKEIFTGAQQQKGNILIPAFAVGRTQDLLFLFSKYYDEWQLDQWMIFLDSPMAADATDIYSHYYALFDQEAQQLLDRHRPFSRLPNFKIVESAEESMALNQIRSGAIIIAASGMCTGGRIRHHLKHHLWHKNCHVLVVGFQAQGTLGRALVDGAKYVRIFGESIKVAAQIHTVGGLSAHADQQGLLDWYNQFTHKPPVILVHGEADTRSQFGQLLSQQHAVKVIQPQWGECIDLRSV